MALKHVNAVVVGAGAGGGVVAKELSEAGLSVVILERGGWVSFEEHGQDELINQRTTVLGNAYGPDERSPRVVEGGPGTLEVVLPHEGGTATTPRASARARSATAPWPGATWRRISGCARPTAPPRARRLRTGRSATTTWSPSMRRPRGDGRVRRHEHESLLAASPQALSDAGLPLQPRGPDARGRGKAPRLPPLSDPDAAQLGTLRRPQRVRPQPRLLGFACPNNAKNGTHNTVIPRALATGNCELRTHSIASEVVVDDRGLARGVGTSTRTTGRSTRPLIWSSYRAAQSKRHGSCSTPSRAVPNGAGNRYDWVGRNLRAMPTPALRAVRGGDL